MLLPRATPPPGPCSPFGAPPVISEETKASQGQGDQVLGSATTRRTPPPFQLSPSLPPLPGKLVGKIQGLQYVEAKEFMLDNIKLIKRLDSMDRPSVATIPPNLRPNLREVPSLLT